MQIESTAPFLQAADNLSAVTAAVFLKFRVWYGNLCPKGSACTIVILHALTLRRTSSKYR